MSRDQVLGVFSTFFLLPGGKAVHLKEYFVNLLFLYFVNKNKSLFFPPLKMWAGFPF